MCRLSQPSIFRCTEYRSWPYVFSGVSFVLRKAGAAATTYLEIFTEGDLCRWKYKIAFKSGDLKFKLGETFDETTADGRAVKVHFWVEGCFLFIKIPFYPSFLGVNFIMRKAGASSTTNMEIFTEGDICRWKYRIWVKTGDLRFKLGEPFDEHTPDGRSVKVAQYNINGTILFNRNTMEP